LKIKYLNNLLLLLLATLLTVSCDKESTSSEEGEKVTLDISTRGILTDAISDPDNAITSIRIMAFYHTNGQFAAQDYKTITVTDQPENIQLKLDPGHYDFAFIVNGDSDTGLTSRLQNYTKAKTFDNLKAEPIASSAFRNDYSIPMLRLIKNIILTGESDLTVGGLATPQPWAVEVERAGIRVDLIIETTAESIKKGFTNLQVINVPKQIYLSPKVNVNGTGSFESPIPGYRTFASNNGDIYDEPAELAGQEVNYTITSSSDEVSFVEKNGKWYWYKRLILPESVLEPTGQEKSGMQLQVTIDDGLGEEQYSLTLSNADETEFTLPRNNRYKVTGTLNPGDYIEFSVSVKEWGNEETEDIVLE